jgi:hypothetical protein
VIYYHDILYLILTLPTSAKQSFVDGHHTVNEQCYSQGTMFWKTIKLLLKEAQFFCEFTMNEGRFYFWVYYHGSPESAKNYKYTIKVSNNGDEEFSYNG